MSRDLRPLFDPRSVAILGASSDPSKWGHWLARSALAAEDRRAVYLVNRGGGEILGRPAHTSLAALPEAPELVAVTLPAAAFEDAVDDALAAGAKAIVAITAGLGEMGAEGRERERAVVERVRAAGAVLLGPNCLGVFDAGTALHLASNELQGGEIGLVSQSGNLALELGMLAADVGLGFSRFASLGNQADLDAADLVAEFARHDATKAIAVYCEDFRDGRAFARAAHAARGAGKPVILLTVGGSNAAVRAARSHTGALVSSLTAVDAACRAAGIERVSTPKELIDVAQALAFAPAPRGRRVGVVADGGGHGVIATDLAVAARLDVPPLSTALAREVASTLPPTAVATNPVDLAGGGEQDFANFERVVRRLLASDEVDAALLTGYFGGYSQYSDDFLEGEVAVARALARAAAETARPLVVHTMYWNAPAATALREGRVPVYREVEAAVGALARLVRHAAKHPRGVPDLPEPALSSPPRADGYWSARDLVEQAGIALAPALRVRTRAEALDAAREVGYPLVVKATGRLHKSDAGGVVLGVADDDELSGALERLEGRLGPGEYSVEAMVSDDDGVELIVGVRRDVRFGPIALVGLGGVHAELLRDVAVALAPISREEGEELLRSLRGAPLLAGARGRQAVDVSAAAEAVAALSIFAAEHPELREIEVNPLLVTPSRAVALDARVVTAENGHFHAG